MDSDLDRQVCGDVDADVEVGIDSARAIEGILRERN
jgi:hypothetical protein